MIGRLRSETHLTGVEKQYSPPRSRCLGRLNLTRRLQAELFNGLFAHFVF